MSGGVLQMQYYLYSSRGESHRTLNVNVRLDVTACVKIRRTHPLGSDNYQILRQCGLRGFPLTVKTMPAFNTVANQHEATRGFTNSR